MTSFKIIPSCRHTVQYMYCGHVATLTEKQILKITNNTRQIEAASSGWPFAIILPQHHCEVCITEGYLEDTELLDD